MTSLRKRDLLLSLKYSTVEACFSVPMTTLTASNLAFAIGFAVEALGWGAEGIGWMAAVPQLCYFAQPPVTHMLQRRFSLYQIMRIGFLLSAVPWFFVWFFPMFGERIHLAFALIFTVSSLGNSIAGVAWSAAMSDVVPLSIRGQYFGRRNLIYSFWTLIVVLAAGEYASYKHNAMLTFGAIFFVAALARFIGLFFLSRMKFPRFIMEKHPGHMDVSEYGVVFRDKNYVILILFAGMWGLLLGIGAPFYNVYVLKKLPMDMGNLMALSTLSSVGSLISYRRWGLLSDRFGNRPVFITCTTLLAVIGIVSWMFSSPTRYVHLYLTYFLFGVMTGGYQLCQFNLMINLVPQDKKTQYISVYYAATSLLTAFGPLLGEWLLQRMPATMGTAFGEPITSYQVVFVASLLAGLGMTFLLHRLREHTARPWRELARVMRSMRAFNPVLGLGSLAEFVITPSAVAQAVRESVRVLKRQKAAVTGVGGELVEGGLKAIKQKLDKDNEEK